MTIAFRLAVPILGQKHGRAGTGLKLSLSMMANWFTAVSHPLTVQDVFSCPRMAWQISLPGLRCPILTQVAVARHCDGNAPYTLPHRGAGLGRSDMASPLRHEMPSGTVGAYPRFGGTIKEAGTG